MMSIEGATAAYKARIARRMQVAELDYIRAYRAA